MKQNKFLFYLMSIVLLYLLIEGIAILGLTVLKTKGISYSPLPKTYLTEAHKKIIQRLVSGDEKYVRFSRDYGWEIKPNAQTELYKANSQGIRAQQEYSLNKPAGKLRILAFGDSYTHGDEVSNEHTWQEFLSQDDQSWEVINMGVPGYGLDQSFLYYKNEGKQFHPDIVLIGFMSENIGRNINTFRPFYRVETGVPLIKPRFIIKDNALHLIKVPFKQLKDYEELLKNEEHTLPKLGKYDYYYNNGVPSGRFDVLPTVRLYKIAMTQLKKKLNRNTATYLNGRYNIQSGGFDILINLIKEFYEQVERDGARPIVLIFPHAGDVRKYQSDGKTSYDPLIFYLKRKQYRYIDLMEIIARKQPPSLSDFYGKYHYNETGNRWSAESISQYLKKRGF